MSSSLLTLPAAKTSASRESSSTPADERRRLDSTRMPDAKQKFGRRESLGALDEGVSVGDSRAGGRLPGSSGRASGAFLWS